MSVGTLTCPCPETHVDFYRALRAMTPETNEFLREITSKRGNVKRLLLQGSGSWSDVLAAWQDYYGAWQTLLVALKASGARSRAPLTFVWRVPYEGDTSVEVSSCVHFETLMILIAMCICYYRMAAVWSGRQGEVLALDHCKRAIACLTHAETVVLPQWRCIAGVPTSVNGPGIWALLSGVTRGLATKVFILYSQEKLAAKGPDKLIKLHLACARQFGAAFHAANAMGRAKVAEGIGRSQRYHEAYAWYLLAITLYDGEDPRCDYAFLAINNAMSLAGTILTGKDGNGHVDFYDAVSDKHRVYARTFKSLKGDARPKDADEWLAKTAMEPYAEFQHSINVPPFAEPPAPTLASPLLFHGSTK